MKKIVVLLTTIALVLPVSAQLRWNSVYQTYISQYKDLAIEEMLKHRSQYHVGARAIGEWRRTGRTGKKGQQPLWY